jgi:hypothetical protein
MNSSELITSLTTLSNQISYYFLVITMPTGIVLNLASIIVFMRPNLNKTNMGFIFTILSIVDTISLLNYTFIVRSSVLFGYNWTFQCGVANYIRRTLFNISSWIQVYVSFDRYIYIYFLVGTHFFKTKMFTFLMLFLMLALVLITNATNLITFPQTRMIDANRTTTSCTTSRAIRILTPIIAMLMRIYLPFLIMIILNTVILLKFLESKKKANMNRNTKKEYRFALITLSMDVSFLVFYLPIAVNLTLIALDEALSIINTPLSDAVFSLYGNIAQLIAISYHALFFFFNIIFNKLFRRELVFMLCYKCYFKQHQQTIQAQIQNNNSTRL